jgi:hypothetical protein
MDTPQYRPRGSDGEWASAPAGAQLRLGLREGIVDGWTFGKNETLADLVASRTTGVGLFYVLLYVAIWGRYVELVGEPPRSNLALSTTMKMPNKTVDRYRRRFVKAFPELEDPAPLYDLVRDHVEDISKDAAEVTAFKLGGYPL